MVAPAHVSQYLRHEKRKSLINKEKINGLFLEDVFEVVLEVVPRLVVAHKEVVLVKADVVVALLCMSVSP